MKAKIAPAERDIRAKTAFLAALLASMPPPLISNGFSERAIRAMTDKVWQFQWRRA
jgi:hypothetical protein